MNLTLTVQDEPAFQIAR